MHMQCLNVGGGRRWGCVRCGDHIVVLECGVVTNNHLTTPQQCANRRCCVVVRDVGAHLHICAVHAMRKVQPVLMQMHDA